MWFILGPLAFVNITIGKILYALALYFAIIEFTFVSGLIWVDHYSVAFKLIFNEIAIIYFAGVGEVILAFAMELPIIKIPIIRTPFEFKPPLSRLLPLLKITLIFNSPKFPYLNPFAMLHIFFPLPFVQRPPNIAKYTIAMCLSIEPLPLVYVSIPMIHSAIAVE